MSRLSFDPVFGAYWLVLAAALVLLGLLVLGPGRGRISRPKRAVLLALRVGVILLVILALLQPRLIYIETRKQPATLILLIDRSQSMSVPDAGGGKTRWQLLQLSLDEAQAALADLAEDFPDLELKAYTFDVQTDPAEVDRARGKLDLPESPQGKQTAIGAALDDVLRAEAGKRLLGVILLSDGAQRAYAPRDLPPQAAAGLLKPLGVPLYTLAFGQSRGLGEAKVDVTGTWSVKVQTAMGEMGATLSLNQSESTLTGEYEGELGTAPIVDGSVSGQEIVFGVRLSIMGREMELVFSGTVEGESMSGTLNLGTMGTAEWEADKSGPGK